MNLDQIFIPIVFGNIFQEINRLTAQATTTVQTVAVLIAIVIGLVVAGKGGWKLNSIIMGIVVGGLLIWGSISGIQYMADQADSTIGMGLVGPALTR